MEMFNHVMVDLTELSVCLFIINKNINKIIYFLDLNKCFISIKNKV